MNKIIETFIDNSQYREIKDITKKSYKSKLKSLYNFLEYPIDKSIMSKVYDYKGMIKTINTKVIKDKRTGEEKNLSIGLKRSYLIICMFLLDSIKYDVEKHTPIREAYKKQLIKLNKNDKQLMSKKEKQAMIKADGKPVKLEDLKEVASMWAKRVKENPDYENLFHLIISLLYTNIRNCVRRNIFNTIKIIYDKKDDNKKDNFLLLSNKKKCFILNHHKTDRKVGVKLITLPRNSLLYKAIMLSLDKFKRTYLLESPSQRKPLDSSAMTRAIRKTFAKINPNITSTVIRKIYLTERFMKDTPLNIRNSIADLFGHSVSTQAKYYEKK